MPNTTSIWIKILLGGGTLFVLVAGGIPQVNNAINHYNQGNQVGNNNPGNHFGWFKNGNHFGLTFSNQYRGAAPIPGTLLLFGGGWAGVAAWNWARRRRAKHQVPG